MKSSSRPKIKQSRRDLKKRTGSLMKKKKLGKKRKKKRKMLRKRKVKRKMPTMKMRMRRERM
jgi:hypothetical protein